MSEYQNWQKEHRHALKLNETLGAEPNAAQDGTAVQVDRRADRHTMRRVQSADRHTMRRVQSADRHTMHHMQSADRHTMRRVQSADRHTMRRVQSADRHTMRRVQSADRHTMRRVQSADRHTMCRVQSVAEVERSVRRLTELCRHGARPHPPPASCHGPRSRVTPSSPSSI